MARANNRSINDPTATRRVHRETGAGDDDLNPARIECLLALPTGAARRRRLFVVRVHGEAIEGTAIRRGDRLVIEPGSRKSIGALVACKTNGAIDFYCVKQDREGRAFLRHPSPEWLPLLPAALQPVLGTVIAVVRRIGSQWRLVRWRLPISSSRSRAAKEAAAGASCADRHPEGLERVILALETRAQVLRRASPQCARALGSAATRLRALRSCLAVVSEPRLSAALVTAIEATTTQARRDFAYGTRIRHAPAPEQLDLLRSAG